MPDFDKLHEEVKKLDALLKDRQEGLSSWCLLVGERWRAIADLWSGPTWNKKEKNVGKIG